MIKSMLARRLIYPFHERIMRRPTFSYLAQLEDSQWLPRSELEKLQERKLTDLLRLACTHTPWHRERILAAGIDPRGHVTLEELRALPVMDKQDATASRDGMVWHGVPGGIYKYNTGGSSGQPLVFYYGRRRQASDAAGRMRARRWWGVEPGDPEVYLWGAPVELDKTDRIKVLRDRLLNQLVLNAFEMSPSRMDNYASAIQSYQPCCIYGYASSLALFSAHVLDRSIRLRLPRLKVVCTTGEPLLEHQRQLIGDAFQVPVANEYGSRDIGFTAHETPQGRILLISESIILEVLDQAGQPVAAGETGEAVMTALESQAQPFIRYRTGDMVRVSGDSCPAGRGLHVIDAVLGRTTDFVVRTDGVIMHALSVIYVMRAVEGIAEFKIVQHTMHDLKVMVVPNVHWREAARSLVVQGLKERLGDDIRIDLQLVDTIQPEASGKYRYVVSEVPLPDGLQVAMQSPINR